ncbi:hypothetical protein [Ornithinimicrobium murale]|uniref:hypothetical protein n=1 Tax=Ornithinimicrobium murale TaxID=1050153 RepID=UPI000E0D6984|nr:hypothetical protein [Ornithinimicrobium murale]
MQRADVTLFGSDGGEVRSNLGQRLSIGKLDAQGAQMMWGSPAIGVTIPREVQQRATTTNKDGVPVEAQCFRFPSPSAPIGTEEGDLRETIRPRDSRHKRLVIVPPEPLADLDSEDKVIEPEYFEYAEAQWAFAQDRPDLDPLLQVKKTTDGRQAASALSMLGLAGGASSPGGEGSTPSRHAGHRRGFETDDEPVAVSDVEDYAVGEFEGYEDPDESLPGGLIVGDLIEEDAGSGVWVVVDEMPEPDPASPGMTAVSWRSDSDESGALSLPEDEQVTVRRLLLTDD